MVTIRADLDSIPEYQPGRQASPMELEAAGIAQLASNEAHWGPSPELRDDILDAVSIINRYPSMSSADLRLRLATKYGVDISNVVVGAGGVEIERQAAAAVIRPGDEVVYAHPSFPDYEILTRINSGTPVPVPLRDHTHDLEAMIAAVTDRTRMLIICNPNNPTGTGVSTNEIRKLLERVPSEVLVLVDEAYFEFAGTALGPSTVELVSEFDNLVVLRTFSKAYGLAAVRVGYGLTSQRLASAMRKVQLPFSVNGFAEAAALAVLDNEGKLLERIAAMRTARAELRATLIDLGFEVPESHGNFVYIPGEPGCEIFRQCEARGISARTLGPGGVRITIGSPSDQERVIEAAAAAAQALQQEAVPS